MAASRATIDDLVTQLRLYKKNPDYAVWLGAGASISSGVPGTSDIVLMLLRRAYETANKAKDGSADQVPGDLILAWANTQNWFTSYPPETSAYVRVMEKIYQAPGIREQFLLDLLAKAKPSPGYEMLGTMLQRGVIDTVFTTNFDQLVRKAADPFLTQPLYEVNSPDQYPPLGPYPPYPRLIRMHGDFWHGNLLNTEGELEETPKKRYEAARLLLRFYGLIVIGYGGADVKIMRDLFSPIFADQNQLRKGLYWCVRRGSPRSPLLDAFLTYAPPDRSYVVEIEDFDGLMASLAAPFAPSPRNATVIKINGGGIGGILQDAESGNYLQFRFNQIVGYRGQTASELHLQEGVKVRYRGSPDSIESVEITGGST